MEMTADNVLKIYCDISVSIMNMGHDILPSTYIAKKFNCSLYKARKIIKQLVEQGLLKSAMDSGYDEEYGVYCIRGYAITDKARKTLIYKRCKWNEAKLCSQCFEDTGSAYSYWKGFSMTEDSDV